eukprot:4495188-Alexandrium_andersonii.AAC.1
MRAEGRGQPGDEAELAPGEPLDHEAAADEVGNAPEDLLELLLRDGDADALGVELEARPDPRDRKPR